MDNFFENEDGLVGGSLTIGFSGRSCCIPGNLTKGLWATLVKAGWFSESGEEVKAMTGGANPAARRLLSGSGRIYLDTESGCGELLNSDGPYLALRRQDHFAGS